jgi:hypothetical protein
MPSSVAELKVRLRPNTFADRLRDGYQARNPPTPTVPRSTSRTCRSNAARTVRWSTVLPVARPGRLPRAPTPKADGPRRARPALHGP